MIESLFISIFALGGLLLALYLYNKKQTHQQPFICPLRGNCAEVIHSEFSKFLGVPVELIGITYYAGLLIGHGLVVASPVLFDWLEPSLLLASTIAFLFSLYLTFIQLVVLKKICTWCLFSAALCLSIFLIAIVGGREVVLPILLEFRPIILVLHILFMALGLGAATLTDIFFLRFLRDLRISQEESDVFSTLSQFIWFALCLMVITGFALYLPQAVSYNDSPKFLAKIIVVSVIIVNGAFLNLSIAPKLAKITFAQPHKHKVGELVLARRFAFVLGPISIVSWYSAFILGSLPAGTELSLISFLKIYALMLLIAITIGQFFEHRLRNKQFPSPWITN
ncbi:vitamin K epoxide reductase family protein [Candidatus Uhrbacteria bacterium]|nr:vitamin K epoxide reductase family protein [Candidatus Uhrbacteria bacterium]